MEKRQDILDRINKAVRHIEKNLEDELALETLADIAHFSPFHFQRLFKETVGETPKQFIKRLRLEKAAHIIVLEPDENILQVTFRVGFQSLESFSRAFKDYYLISPDHFRKSPEEEKVGIVQKPVRHGAFLNSETYLPPELPQVSTEPDLAVIIVRRPPMKVVFIQTTLGSSSQITSCFRKVKQWAEARDLISPEIQPFGLMRDYPLFTALDKCRYQTCIQVDQKPEISGQIQYQELPAATYASFTVHGSMAEIIKTVTSFVRNWLQESAWQIVHEAAYQIPINDPLTTPFDSNSYQILIQVQPK